MSIKESLRARRTDASRSFAMVNVVVDPFHIPRRSVPRSMSVGINWGEDTEALDGYPWEVLTAVMVDVTREGVSIRRGTPVTCTVVRDDKGDLLHLRFVTVMECKKAIPDNNILEWGWGEIHFHTWL